MSWLRDAGLTAAGRWTPNPQVQDLAERLVGALGYRGILDLDFRGCAGTGRYHLLDFNPRPGAQFRLFTDTADLDVVRALHLDLTHRPLPEGAAWSGRVIVVENYAPRLPGWAMWGLWARHVARRVLDRVRRMGKRSGPPAARVVRQVPAQVAGDEKAGRR